MISSRFKLPANGTCTSYGQTTMQPDIVASMLSRMAGTAVMNITTLLPPGIVSWPRDFKHVRIFTGPVLQSLELDLMLSVPTMLAQDRQARSSKKTIIPITTSISLTNGVPRLDIHTTIKNTVLDHRLRVHFPVPFSVERKCSGWPL